MTTEVLSRRALNRATLDRQMLLRRWRLPLVEAVEHLGGLQAQTPLTWYTGMWTRLEDFDPVALGELVTKRQVVRIGLMRGTIHLVSAEDCLALRPLLQRVFDRALKSNFGRGIKDIDPGKLIAAGRELVEEKPLVFSELGKLLKERWPDNDAASLAQAIRAWVPLVQVPPRGVWGSSGVAAHTSAETWLGRPMVSMSLDELFTRFLTAFGPASVKDVQNWCGLTKLNEVADRLRPRLVTFRDENGVELFDLPDAPRPDPDTPAPARFLYDFDNLLLSHSDRSRVITDGYIGQNFWEHGPMPAAVLIDGFTAGTWRISRSRGAALLEVQPFDRPLAATDVHELTEEGGRLLEYAAPGRTYDIRFIAPSPTWAFAK